VINRPPKRLAPRNVRVVDLAQQPNGRDNVSRPHHLPLSARNHPALLSVVPDKGLELRVEVVVLGQIEPFDDVVYVREDLGLSEILFLPCPILEEILVE
jgi:hypothetical protein